MGGIYEVCCYDWLRCHDRCAKFHKDRFGHLKVSRKEFIDMQTAWKSHKPAFIFQNKENDANTGWNVEALEVF
jgi:hypothetical protein